VMMELCRRLTQKGKKMTPAEATDYIVIPQSKCELCMQSQFKFYLSLLVRA
jgi:hypothetical protein